MNIDMHTHTNRYSICSETDPEDIIGRVMETNLDGIVITEHNSMWTARERQQLLENAHGILLLWGIEMTAESGMHYLSYFDLDGSAPRLYENMNDFELLAEVHRVGGVVIPAHIFRYGRKIKLQELENLNVYGLEIKSINITDEEMRRSINYANKLNLCQIAGSDSHTAYDIGTYYTKFNYEIKNENDLIYALKNNLCEPVTETKIHSNF